MKLLKFLLNTIKIVAWLIATVFVIALYVAFYIGFVDAIAQNDVPNMIAMGPFIGLYALLHYSLLLLVNKWTYKDKFWGFKFFSTLKDIGGFKGFAIGLVVVLLGAITCLGAVFVHVYFSLVVLGIKKPYNGKATYTPSTYHYTPTSSTNNTTYTPSYTPSYTPTTSSTTTTTTTSSPTYDIEEYRRYMHNNLRASDISVSCGYSKFVKSAKLTSLSLSISSGSSPSVRASGTVTVYVDNYAVRSYIGVDSHHNSTYANSNVVDSEIRSAMSTAKDSAESQLESRIRSLTRSFASQHNGAPSSVNESAYVSTRKG